MQVNEVEWPRMIHPVDNHVGLRIRHRRKLLGMTQQQLANGVGIRFQQIQKYESGANRVSASRLWDLSRRLKVPVSYFFDGIEPPLRANNDDTVLRADIMHDKETIDLIRAYYALDEQPRQRLLELAKAMHTAA